MNLNIDYRKVFIVLLAAILIAIPTAAVLQNKNNQIEKSEQQRIFEIEKRDSQLKDLQIEKNKSETQLEKERKESEKLKRENEQLQKDLQAKKAREAEEARLAAAERERKQQQQAAVSVSSVGISGNCESYRPIVQKYFGSATNAAMITMSKESGCRPTVVSPTNDHGLFQLNGIKVYDPEENIKIAYHQKFVTPRRGTKPNFSAWYAVCTPDLIPKYPGIWCS